MELVRAGAYGGIISRREQVLAHKRKGKGGRTHLVSPQMAAAAAIEGRFVDIRNWH